MASARLSLIRSCGACYRKHPDFGQGSQVSKALPCPEICSNYSATSDGYALMSGPSGRSGFNHQFLCGEDDARDKHITHITRTASPPLTIRLYTLHTSICLLFIVRNTLSHINSSDALTTLTVSVLYLIKVLKRKRNTAVFGGQGRHFRTLTDPPSSLTTLTRSPPLGASL
jgi:hypothetical protein